MKKFALFALALLIPAISHAASPWPQEPSSFFGIKFGVPVSDQVPKCDDVKTEMCLGQKLAFYYPIQNVPNYYDVSVLEVEGKVAQVTANFKREDAQNVQDALVTRFGKPMFKQISVVKTRMNLALEETSMRWIGKMVVIEFRSIATNVDEGDLIVTTRAFWDTLQRNARRDQKERSKQF